MSDDKGVIIKAIVEKEVRNSFKAACARGGRSMNDVLIDLIGHYVYETEQGSISSRPKNTPSNHQGEVRGEAA
jgi:ParG